MYNIYINIKLEHIFWEKKLITVLFFFSGIVYVMDVTQKYIPISNNRKSDAKVTRHIFKVIQVAKVLAF